MEFEGAAMNHYYLFRVFPRDTARQRVLSMEVQTTPNAKRFYGTDSFGNSYFYGSIPDPHTAFSLDICGKVRTGFAKYEEQAAAGEPSILLFRSASKYTQLGPALQKYRDEHTLSFSQPVYERVLAYMHTIHQDFTYRKSVTDIRTTAEEAMTMKCGVCQDYTHVLLALCRADRIPARYAVGMMAGEGESHAWAEALCRGRWVGFDVTNDQLIDDRYIKISHGRDFMDCTVSRGIFTGGEQKQTVTVTVRGEQSQQKGMNL